MLSQKKEWKRSLRLAWPFAVLCLLFLAAVPAAAQIDPMRSGWALVTGHWSKGAPDTPAWVDLDSWKLVTRFDGNPAAAEPEPNPWIPVAGDWDGSGVSTVKMFNSQTWQLVDLAKGPIAGDSSLPPGPCVPVAGDWDGRGIDTVLVVDLRDQSVHKLSEGPIKIDRYDPQPQPWLPLAGKWDGRVDSIAWVRADGAFNAWQPVAGDWDGTGFDTVAAVHNQSGELVFGSEAKSSARKAAGGGCYTVSKNQVDIVKVFYGLDGSVTVIHIKMHEEWTCCLIGPAGPYACSKKLVAG